MKLRLDARISSDSSDAVGRLLVAKFGAPAVRRDGSDWVVRAEVESASARDANRELLSGLRRVDDAEGAPELAEAIQNQSGMADTGNGAEAEHHFLVHVQHGDQQHQGPQQRGAVVLAGLRIGAEGTGVVVPDHHDEARPQNGEQGREPGAPAYPRPMVTVADRSEGAVDVANIGLLDPR
jgi:hypothetical protein